MSINGPEGYRNRNPTPAFRQQIKVIPELKERYESYFNPAEKPYKRGQVKGVWVIASGGVRYCEFRPVEVYWSPPVQEGNSRASIIAAIDQNNKTLTELESRI
jgi:hypothetical protein